MGAGYYILLWLSVRMVRNFLSGWFQTDVHDYQLRIRLWYMLLNDNRFAALRLMVNYICVYWVMFKFAGPITKPIWCRCDVQYKIEITKRNNANSEVGELHNQVLTQYSWYCRNVVPIFLRNCYSFCSLKEKKTFLLHIIFVYINWVLIAVINDI